MARWDYIVTGNGMYVARRDGVDAASVMMLDDVDLQSIRMKLWVNANNDLDETTEADATYRERGWVSKAEFDFLWNETVLEAHGQESATRAYLNDMWKADFAPLGHPLARPDFERWRNVMTVACTPRTESAA